MSSGNILGQLQKWTPFSVGVIITLVFSLGVAAYCIVSGRELPVWDYQILIVAGSILGGTGLISHGVDVANGVANKTAQAVVKQAVEEGIIQPNDKEVKSA